MALVCIEHNCRKAKGHKLFTTLCFAILRLFGFLQHYQPRQGQHMDKPFLQNMIIPLPPFLHHTILGGMGSYRGLFLAPALAFGEGLFLQVFWSVACFFW